MSLIFFKTIAAFSIFLISIAAVAYPLIKRDLLNKEHALGLGEALASGIFLGAAFFHLLPDSIKLFNQVNPNFSYPLPEAICVLGFLLLLFLEKLSLRSATQHSHTIGPTILVIMLIIHALTEGAAIGIGATFMEMLMLFIAVIAHKGSESFALCILMLRNHWPIKRTVIIIIIFALMTPLGISIGGIINHFLAATNGRFIASIFNAFAAGTFLYISTLHHLHAHQHNENRKSFLEFMCLVLGVITMGLLAI